MPSRIKRMSQKLSKWRRKIMATFKWSNFDCSRAEKLLLIGLPADNKCGRSEAAVLRAGAPGE